jgi:tight adherence protein D
MHLFRALIISFSLSLFLGCSTTPNDTVTAQALTYDKQEQVYVNTKDYNKLVTLYKERLADQDEIETRLKLVKVYIDMNDIESAEFNLNLIGTSKTLQAQIDYLFALVNYEKEYLGAAAIYAKKAVDGSNGFESAENLLGLIYATLGDYEQARHYFYMARQHLADDIKIKNNLAMVDMLEGNYHQATYRLEPLVNNGVQDEQVIANLAFAYAKTGNFNAFTALYFDSGASLTELQSAFSALEAVTTENKTLTSMPESPKKGTELLL